MKGMKYISKYAHLQVEVLQPIEARNIYSVEKRTSNENIIAVCSFSADGKTCCPMIIYPTKKIPERI